MNAEENDADRIATAPDALGEDEASLADLARHASAYAQALVRLLAGELRLARASATRLAAGALLLPVLALLVLLTLDALLASLLQQWLQYWPGSIAAVLFLDCAALLVLIVALRVWWRNLSLPRTRKALGELFSRLD